MGTEENKIYTLEEYMKQVELWFQRYDIIHNTSIKRQIYIASDTVDVRMF